ncbi:uncharacterized protein METZ01_LOCUS287683, partial [marine metagenome]
VINNLPHTNGRAFPVELHGGFVAVGCMFVSAI